MRNSSEAAYQSLPLSDALKMLSMKSADELSDYAAMREREWEVDTKNNVVRFREDNKADLTVPSQVRRAPPGEEFRDVRIPTRARLDI